MRFIYFASVRENIGRDEDAFTLPTDIETVAQCLDWLAQKDSRYRTAFADRAKLRFALDQQMVDAATQIDGAEELAIFPPVTGG